jgi:hypothetical protein
MELVGLMALETISNLLKDNRRSYGNSKLSRGKTFFAALRLGDNPASYTVESSAEDFLARTLK